MWTHCRIILLGLAVLALAGWQPAAQASDAPVPPPESTAQDLQYDGIFLCSSHLSKAVRAAGGSINSRTLMHLRLTDPNTLEPLAWFQNQISKTIRRALQTRINYSIVNENGLKPKENFYVIQQLYLKELNEQLLDIGGTQYYLQALDSSIHTILENSPSLGTLVHVNYKDRVVVSELSPEDFEIKVLGPARNLTENYINFLSRDSGERVDWAAFLKRSLAVNSGKSIEEGLFKVRLGLLGLNENQWRAEIAQTRATVLQMVKSENEIPVLLRKFRWIENLPGMTEKWEQKNFAGFKKSQVSETLRRYIELLSAGDMLPLPEAISPWQRKSYDSLKDVIDKTPQAALDRFKSLANRIPEAWAIHRSYFLRASLGKRIIISTDLRGLGNRAMEAREAWVAAGAKVSDLSKIYQSPTDFMEERHQALRKALRYVVGLSSGVDSYVSGDDGLWSIPMLNPEKLEELRTLLNKFSKDFYFHIEIIEDSDNTETARKNTAIAINNAWRALFETKVKLKSTQPDDMIDELKFDALEGERDRDEAPPETP